MFYPLVWVHVVATSYSSVKAVKVESLKVMSEGSDLAMLAKDYVYQTDPQAQTDPQLDTNTSHNRVQATPPNPQIPKRPQWAPTESKMAPNSLIRAYETQGPAACMPGALASTCGLSASSISEVPGDVEALDCVARVTAPTLASTCAEDLLPQHPIRA